MSAISKRRGGVITYGLERVRCSFPQRCLGKEVVTSATVIGDALVCPVAQKATQTRQKAPGQAEIPKAVSPKQS